MEWRALGASLYEGDNLIATFKGPYAKACQDAEIAAWARNAMLAQLVENSKPQNDDGE